ncbi:MAG: glycosyltransferase [Myxococcota bacterium]
MTAPIRLLLTAFASVPGSSPHASAVLSTARALRAEIDIVTVKAERRPHVEALGRSSRMFRVPVGFGTSEERLSAFGRAVVRQLEAQAYDAVHVRGPIEGALVAQRRASLGFRLIYEVATFADEADGLAAEQAWAKAHLFCAEQADLILVPTEAAGRGLAEIGHAGKVAVVTPATDLDQFDWWPTVGDGATRLLYLGQFEAERDLTTLLSAARRLRRNHEVEVLLAGDRDSERRNRIRRVADGLGLTDTVQIRDEPRLQALSKLIGASDICVVPASACPRFLELGDLPQPLLEYAACQRPIVAAGVPSIAEVVRDEEEALLYPPGDDEALADAILTLQDDSELRDRLVENAYRRVRMSYGRGAHRRRMAEVYELLFADSQRYDPWEEAFERAETSLIDLGEDGSIDRSEGREATDLLDALPVESDSSPRTDPFLRMSEQVLYRPEGGDTPFGDTSPGTALPNELPGSPTRIRKQDFRDTDHSVED